MKTFRNLTLIGTSHIAQQSINEVTTVIEAIKPEIIAIELDQTRFTALTSKKKRKLRLTDLPQIGFKGYLFAVIGAYLQKKLGQIVNVEPGAEMLTAIKLAQQHHNQLALVDQPIEITLKRFSQDFSWKEKFRLLADFFRGFFFRKRELKRYGLENLDLTQVPQEELIKKMIKNLKQRYPNLYRVLIKERNHYLARGLSLLIKKNPESKIVAIVGAGHEAELIRLIKKKVS